MKIMIVNSLYSPYRVGGAEVSVQLLAEQLASAGHQVCVLTLHELKNKKTAVINNVKVIYLPLKNIYWNFSNSKQPKIKKIIWHLFDNYNFAMKKLVRDEISEFKPDVVHTNNLSGFSVSIWDVIKDKNIKLVHTSRDYYLFHPNSTLFKNNKIMSTDNLSVKIWSYIKRKKSTKVDEYIGISEFIKNLHESNGFFIKSKKNVIYNSVTKYECHSIECEQTRVGFIGRLSFEKGFDKYCKLAQECDSSKYSFMAAGNFSNTKNDEYLKEIANQSGVKLLGYINIEDFLHKTDVIVLPIKWNEPFGRTVVECALAGKIVFTTPVGSIPELSKILPNIVVCSDINSVFKKINIKKMLSTSYSINTEIFEPQMISNNYIDKYHTAR